MNASVSSLTKQFHFLSCKKCRIVGDLGGDLGFSTGKGVKSVGNAVLQCFTMFYNF